MKLFKCNACNSDYEDYYPLDDMCLKCKKGTINLVTSGRYILSTKYVDNPVEEVDKFQKCNEKTSVLSDCTENKHGA